MQYLKDAARTLLCMVLLLAALEGGLRLAQVHYTASLYMPDTERGYALRPNAHGWDVEENPNFVRINSAGMRDREHSLARPPHTLRIAVIGDSAAEARQVPLEQTFVSVIEKRLAGCAPGGQNVEVLNFAVPGYSLAQEWLTLRGQVLRFDPQIVILAMSMATAVTRNLRILNPGGPDAPVFELRDGKLVPDAQTRARGPVNARALYWKNLSSDWMNASDLLLLVNEGRIHSREFAGKLRELLHPPQPTHASPSDPAAVPSDFAATWPYLGPANPILRKAWDVTEAILLAMRDDCKAGHRDFWIVTLDMTGQVHPDVAERKALMRRLGVPSLQIADEEVARFAAANGIEHLMLVPVTADYAAVHRTALHGFPGQPLNDGHWNALGHRVAGERIAQELCAKWR